MINYLHKKLTSLETLISLIYRWIYNYYVRKVNYLWINSYTLQPSHSSHSSHNCRKAVFFNTIVECLIKELSCHAGINKVCQGIKQIISHR